MRAPTIWILVIAATLGAAIPVRGAETRSPSSPKGAAAPKPEPVVSGPGEQLGAHFDRVVTALRQAPTEASGLQGNPGHAALLAMFDLQETARRVVDRGVGADLTTAQKHDLRMALTDVMSGVIRRIADHLRLAHDASLERYASQRLAFRQSSNDGREAVVHGALPGKGGREIPMMAWMVLRGPRWLVYDIRVDDDGLIDSYQAQCAAILRRSSYTALLQRLRDKREFLDVDQPITEAFVRPGDALSTSAGPVRPPVPPTMSP
jgi:hypothetical protein